MSGLFDIISIPLGYILKFCYNLTNNYLLSLLLFAIVMQIILCPFSIKQQKNSIKQARLAPKVAAIRKKYAGRTDRATQQKMQEETMELYQENGSSPTAGCLPLLIQMPILLALFQVVTRPLRYLCGLSVDAIARLKELMGAALETGSNINFEQINMVNVLQAEGVEKYVAQEPELLAKLADAKLPHFQMGVFDLSKAPNADGLWNWLMLIPVLTFVFLIVTQLLTRKFTYQPPEQAEAQNSMSMKIMMFSMPLLSAWFAMMYPAAIGIYWIFRNLITTLQQFILAKVMPVPRFTAEDYKEAERQLAGKKPKKKELTPEEAEKKRAKSLHYIDADDEDAQSSSPAEDKPVFSRYYDGDEPIYAKEEAAKSKGKGKKSRLVAGEKEKSEDKPEGTLNGEPKDEN